MVMRRARSGAGSLWRGVALAAAGAGLGLGAVAGSAAADPATLTLDPAQSSVHFEVDSTLHRVHGTAHLTRGELHFDTAGGAVSGAVEVDATSTDTGNGLRDDNLHEDVLESDRFPRIVFRPERVDVDRIQGSEADVRVTGRIDIHGAEHPLVVPVHVRVEGERAEVTASFPVPYVAWGMEDPSNFLLSVDDVVSVRVEAVGRIVPPPSPAPAAD